MECKLPLDRRPKTKVHEESHRVFESEICEFFVVLEGANQPVDQITSNESRLQQTPAQEVSGHMHVSLNVLYMYCIFLVEFQLESRKLYEKGKSAPDAELLLCGEDVLTCERVDRIDARRLRQLAHSGRHC